MSLTTAPTRTLYRAFEHARRNRRLGDSPEHRMVVLLDMARELHRRGWRPTPSTPGFLYSNP